MTQRNIGIEVSESALEVLAALDAAPLDVGCLPDELEAVIDERLEDVRSQAIAAHGALWGSAESEGSDAAHVAHHPRS